jgi:hypothetical protein
MGRAGNIISGKVIRHRANNGKEHLFPLNGNHAIRVTGACTRGLQLQICKEKSQFRRRETKLMSN